MKKKILVILSVMTLVFSLVWVNNSQATGNTYIISPEIGVNLRAEPIQEGAVVAKLKQGYRVEVLEKSGEWMKVSYEGKQGYIKSEHLKLLDIDLIAAYKHYATILKEEEDAYYSLLYDFTQDGLEELYIVERTDDGFRHKMFSGQKELLDETVYDKGLKIYWDNYNYYLVTFNYWIGEESFKPSEVGISSQHELVYAEMYGENMDIIRSGNLSLNKINAQKKNTMYVSNFETNGEYFEVDDDIQFDLYSIAKKKVTKEEWDKVIPIPDYVNVPNLLLIFNHEPALGMEPGIDYQSNFDETIDKLYALYEKYNDSSVELLLEETEIKEIEQYTNYMLQSGFLNDGNNSEIDYFALLNMALYYTMEDSELYDEENYKYKHPKLKVDEWAYNNFGVKLDNEKLKDQILKYEQQHGPTSIEIYDEYYIAPGSGDVGIGNEPYIINSYPLEDDFIALEYVHGYMKELTVMTTAPQYIIVKKVEATDGKTYYPYIKNVQHLENIDYDALNKYADLLDVVKDNKKVKQVDKQAADPLVKGSNEEEQGKMKNSTLYTLIIAGGLVLIVAVVVLVNVRNRRNVGGIKTKD